MAYPIFGSPRPQFTDSSGAPYASGTISILDPADDSVKACYPTAADADASTNGTSASLTLNARGQPSQDMWGKDGENYKHVILDVNAAAVDTFDAIRLPGSSRRSTVTFTSADATPTVAEGDLFITAGTTAITDFDDGQVGDVIEVKCSATQRITITNNAAIALKDNRSWHMQIHDTLTLAMFVDQKWVEVGRSENSPTSGVTLDDDVYSANNTLADVSSLSGLILAPATYYQLDGFLKANSTAVSQDLQIKFVTDNAFQEEAYSYHSVDTAGTTTSDTGPLTTALTIDIAGNLTIGVRLSGMILTHATLECDVDFQAAQGTAAGVSTIEKGSWIRYKLIGKDS